MMSTREHVLILVGVGRMCVPGYVYIYICARVGFIKKNDPKSSAQEAIFKSRLGEGTRSNVNRLGFLLSSSLILNSLFPQSFPLLLLLLLWRQRLSI